LPRAVAALVLVLAACASSASRADPAHRASPSTTPARGVELAAHAEALPTNQLAALRAVGAIGPQQIPTAVLRGVEASNAFSHAALTTPPTVAPADPHVASTLAQQLADARSAAIRLMRLPHLERAGYYLGSYFVPGVGGHYIDWHLVGARFDPTRPAMLLIDDTPGHVPRLAGFSYWVRSATPPAGFAGDTDQWHRHFGLCFAGGILAREGVPTAAQCAGTWMNGSDLWMLHAWVVPGYENTAGVFAPRNLDLCPARIGNENTFC
jgi:hypothetical protein